MDFPLRKCIAEGERWGYTGADIHASTPLLSLSTPGTQPLLQILIAALFCAANVVCCHLLFLRRRHCCFSCLQYQLSSKLGIPPDIAGQIIHFPLGKGIAEWENGQDTGTNILALTLSSSRPIPNLSKVSRFPLRSSMAGALPVPCHLPRLLLRRRRHCFLKYHQY